MYLALCPTSAAKYNEFIKKARDKDDKFLDIMIQVEEYDFNKSDKYAVDIVLDKDRVIRFTAQHLTDIKTIIKQDSKQ